MAMSLFNLIVAELFAFQKFKELTKAGTPGSPAITEVRAIDCY
jgi:hypothetical protein